MSSNDDTELDALLASLDDGVIVRVSSDGVPTQVGHLAAAAIRSLRAELTSALEREKWSNDGWVTVAGALVETYAGGPNNLPACVVQMAHRLRAATTRAETAEAENEALKVRLRAAGVVC
jgi:hypothetical protein